VPRDDEPTAALTSRTAVIATLLLAGAIILMVIVVQGWDDGGDATASGPVVEGSIARDFTLTSLDGQPVSLSDYAGHPVLINFWASWCPPCREEFPVLADARTAYADSGFEVLGVTHNDGPVESRRFVEDSGAEWPMLPDSEDAVWATYGGVGLPTSYFVDADGVVQRVHIGPVTNEQLTDHLAAIGLPAETVQAEGAA